MHEHKGDFQEPRPRTYLENVRSDRARRRQTADENLSPGWCLLNVRVKDRLPFSLVFLPDRGGVVGTGLVFSVVGTLLQRPAYEPTRTKFARQRLYAPAPLLLDHTISIVLEQQKFRGSGTQGLSFSQESGRLPVMKLEYDSH